MKHDHRYYRGVNPSRFDLSSHAILAVYGVYACLLAQHSGIGYEATALTACHFTFALSNTIRSPQVDVCGKLCKRFILYPKGTLTMVKGLTEPQATYRSPVHAIS